MSSLREARGSLANPCGAGVFWGAFWGANAAARAFGPIGTVYDANAR
jgi:hypothetical protein